MLSLTPYLSFSGNCAEALEFYQHALGGEIVQKMTYGESGQQVSPEHTNRIMHSVFKSEGISFMACDAPSHQPFVQGSKISLAIALNDTSVQDRIFQKLSVGGMVTMQLADQFWGARFGMVLDRFGIHWMLNCEKK